MLDATGPSGLLTVNPRELLKSQKKLKKNNKYNKHKNKKKEYKSKHIRDLYEKQDTNESKFDVFSNTEEITKIHYDEFFCGYPSKYTEYISNVLYRFFYKTSFQGQIMLIL